MLLTESERASYTIGRKAMKHIRWVIVGAMLVGFTFLSSPDVSQAGPPSSPNPNNNGKPAATVNPPGLALLPPGWAELPPAFCEGGYLPYYCNPPGQRGNPPPGQTQTPPGETVTSPGHDTDDDDALIP